MKKYISYGSLSKEEKKEAIKKFNKSKKGNELNPIYSRLLLEGAVSLLCAIAFVVYAIITNSAWWYYLIGGILFVFGIVLLVAQVSLKRKVVERMLNQ